MNKFVFILLAAAVGLLSEYVAYEAIVHTKQAKASRTDPYAFIVRLVHNGQTFCSGSVIDSTTIVTAAHCVLQQTPLGAYLDPDIEIDIRPGDNRALGVTAKVFWVTTQLDTAVLKGDFSYFTPAKYLSDITELNKVRVKGTRLISCGYALGNYLYCNGGEYLGSYGFGIRVSTVLIPGMSGGPTMTSDGTVVAVNNLVTDNESVVTLIYNMDNHKTPPKN